MKNIKNKKFLLKIIQISAIAIIVIGSVIILLSFNSDFIHYKLKGNISPLSFLQEANLVNILNLIILLTVFYPFSNAILHIITTTPRIIKSNIVSWIFSPIEAFFGFLQMSVSIFVGLVIIFGGIGNEVNNKEIIGILLIFLSILVFGFFGMWKKPHEHRTSTDRLFINNARTTINTFVYVFLLYILLSEIVLFGFFQILAGSFICAVGGIVEWVTEEMINPPKRDDDTAKSVSSKAGHFYEDDDDDDDDDDDAFYKEQESK